MVGIKNIKHDLNYIQIYASLREKKKRWSHMVLLEHNSFKDGYLVYPNNKMFGNLDLVMYEFDFDNQCWIVILPDKKAYAFLKLAFPDKIDLVLTKRQAHYLWNPVYPLL
jgi:hypothetical protein